MKRLLLFLAMAVGVAHAQGFYTGQALANNPFNSGMFPISNAQVRVCGPNAIGSPCTPTAEAAGTPITDAFGNQLTVVGGNFGQLQADVNGRFTFGCPTPGNYIVQVATTVNNTPQNQYKTSCGGGSSILGFAGTPIGTCTPLQLAVNTTNGNFYTCSGGVWILVVNIAVGTAGQFVAYTNGNILGPDPNLNDAVTNPGQINSLLPFSTPQINLTGLIGGFEVTSTGGTLSTPGASLGGIGIGPGAIPQINPNNAGWFAIPYITINGVALANTANNTNFSNSSPSAPTNGLNVQWQFSGQNISAALVGDGNAAHCLLGTGVFGACSGGGGSVTLDSILAAAASHTIANGNFPQTWNWAQTTASQTAFSFGETSAATGAGDFEVGISTLAGSTATPLLVTNSLTGTQTIPAVSITPTWNTTGVATGVFFNVTNTGSGASSILADWQVNGSSQVRWDKVGNVYANNSYGGTGAGTNLLFCGGVSGCGSTNTNAQTGSATYLGSDNSGSGSSTKAGAAIFRGGMLTNATPNAAALEGFVQIGAGALKGTTIANVGDVLTASGADTLTDCPLGCTAIVGIATNTANPLSYVMYGTALVKLDAAGFLGTFGSHICGPPASTGTIGLAHDNGATLCPAGQNIGISLADVGTAVQMSGNSTASTAMSTTLIKVALHIGD